MTPRIAQLWRFPVKSLQGEPVESIQITDQGLEGDRRFAIFDVESGFGLTARRAPELLFASATTLPDDSVQIRLPDGDIATDDAALSAWLGRPVALRSTTDQLARRYENPADFEHEESSRWEPFGGSRGAFHDSAGAVVSLVSRATLGAWAPRRFRTNIVVTETDEDSLVGTTVEIGGAHLHVGMRITRCVMTTRPQPDHIDRDLQVLRDIHRQRDGYLAVGATVITPGTIAIGDPLKPATTTRG